MGRGIAIGIAVLLASAARGEQPDWEILGGEKVIEVITQDADGDVRETKVWFVLLDGEPYLRTNDSRWLENLRRDAVCRLRFEGGGEYEFRTDEVAGDEIVDRVDDASAEKYGWQESLIHPFRMSKPEILRLEATGEGG